METTKITTFFDTPHTVSFPNIQQYVDIERLKTVLTDGRYPIMGLSYLESTKKALDLVDAVAYGSILLGSGFMKQLNCVEVKDVLLLSTADPKVKELRRWYKEEYTPFHNAIEERTDRPAQNMADELTGDSDEEGNKAEETKDETQS